MNRKLSETLGVVVFYLVALAMIAASCFFAAKAYGESPFPQHERSVCRVAVDVPGGRQYGSGVLYHDKQHVLTCAHTFGHNPGNIRVGFFNGVSTQAALVSLQPEQDLAVLRLAQPVELTPLYLSSQPLTVGQRAWCIGCGGTGKMQWMSGTLAWFDQTGNDQFFRGATARQGDSGGPVLNANGMIVGVLTTTGNNEIGAVRHGPIRRLLTSVFGNCPGGVCPPRQRYFTPQPQIVQVRPQVVPMPRPVPVPQVQPQVDYEQIIKSVVEVMAKDERFKGPAGQPGRDGTDGLNGIMGPQGPRGDSAEIDIKAVADLVAERLASAPPNSELAKRLRGPKGDKGENGTVTIRLVTEDGAELYKLADIPTGNDVDIPLRRYTQGQ